MQSKDIRPDACVLLQLLCPHVWNTYVLPALQCMGLPCNSAHYPEFAGANAIKTCSHDLAPCSNVPAFTLTQNCIVRGTIA